MPKTVIVSTVAQERIRTIVETYEQECKGLGVKLHENIQVVLAMIAEYPDMYEEIRPRIRRAILRRFKFSLFYVVERDFVRVISLFHQADDPRKWPRPHR